MPTSIDFDDAAGSPAKINYSIPLPGQNTGKRFVQLELGLDPAVDYLESARTDGQSFAEQAGITKSGTSVNINNERAGNFLRDRLIGMGHSSRSVERAVSALPSMLDKTFNASAFALDGGNIPGTTTPPPDGDDGWVVDPILGDPLVLVADFANKAVEGIVVVPGSGAGGSGTTTEVPEVEVPDPQLFIIETYGVSSFLGDYGMGRTIRTFTLLPGESTTIRLKTWQSSKQSIKQSSSIIDSHEQSAKERFSNTVQNETTDKKTQSKSKKWAVEAKAKASWGWGSASVKASAEGESHSAREQFAKAASESVAEHSRDASSKREMSVSSSSESEVETGEERVIERVISNVNMRRVLNFVFRELNQTYTTKLHLKNVHIGFTNGFSDTWRQVPISGLHGLLKEVLEPAVIDDVAIRILKIAGTVFNNNDIPVRVLEKVTYTSQTDAVEIAEVALDPEGNFTPPTDNSYYRFKKGPLSQAGDTNMVDGVLLSEQSIVMRTDSAIVEALLGQSDALDNYAMEIQEAAATKETLSNDRARMLTSTVESIQDPAARAEAAAKLFGPSEPGGSGA